MHRFAICIIERRRVSLLILICSLCSCSLLYSYRNIDRVIRWSLDNYVSWTDAQNKQLRARLDAQLAWNRQTQLPRYRAWLETLDKNLDNDVDIAQLQRAADQLQGFWQGTMAHAQDDICAQLALLSDRQVADMIAAARDKQADVKAEYDDLTTAGLIKKRNREMRSKVKYWFGAIDDKQGALILAWAEQLPDGRARWLASRTRWTDAFEQALRHRHESELFAAEIQRLFVTPQQNWDEEYRELSQHSIDATLQLFAALHNARSPQQRKAEHERSAQWLATLDQLALP